MYETKPLDTLVEQSPEGLEGKIGRTNFIESAAEVRRRERRIRNLLPKNLTSRWPRLTNALAIGICALNLSINEACAKKENAETTKLTPKQEQIIENVVGIPIQDLLREFDVEFSADSDRNGKYIIHVGQYHETLPDFSGLFNEPSVIASQKRIEFPLLHIIQTNNLPCIFREGVGDETVMHETRENLLKTMSYLDEIIQLPITNLDDLQKTSRALYASMEIIEEPLTKGYVAPKMQILLDKASAAIRGEKIKPQNSHEEQMLQLIQTSLQGVRLYLSIIVKDPYLHGAVFKLYMERKIQTICPTEDDELNEAAFHAIHKRREILELLDEAEKTTPLNKSHLYTLEKRYEKAKEEEDEKTFIAREREVLRKIGNYDRSNLSQGVIPGHILLVFGDAHDFTQAVNEWNKKNPASAIDRGLIKIGQK